MNSFEEQVQKQIQKFKNLPLRQLEQETIQKRVSWFQTHHSLQPAGAPPTPRDAFDLLFFEYMGLHPQDLPVFSESGTKIEWLSKNPCNTLAACSQLGMETTNVCRKVYEKPTQALISQLDPQLRFGRSYEEIRPHTAACHEWIIKVDFVSMMKLAIEEAKQSLQEGNKGYGAVVVINGEVSASAHDTASTNRDPSQHAEMNALRQAAAANVDANLCGAILFTTCEPCPMCTAMAIWSNITTIVYGASIAATAALGKSRILVSAQELVAKSPAWLEVIGGVMPEECLSLYS